MQEIAATALPAGMDIDWSDLSYQEATQGQLPTEKKMLEELIKGIKFAEGTLLDPEIAEVFARVLENRFGSYLQ